MSVKKPVAIYIDNLPDNEQIIFKLIFSVSERSKNRNHFYQYVSDRKHAEIEIVSAGNTPKGNDSDTKINSITVVNSAGSLDAGAQHQILRPIIASRVLTVLDTFIAASNDEHEAVQQNSKLENTNLKKDNHVPDSKSESIQEDELGYVAELDNSGEFEFSISEEEASNLAIVHDEVLANPANKLDPVVDTNHAKQDLQNVTALAQTENSKENVNQVDTATSPMKRALVVDDSASVRKQLEIELNLFNVEVDFAEDAERAFDLLHRNTYDVAFLDVVLPDQDGYTICKSIKTSSEKKRMKVIMLTGKSTHADKVRGSLAGCDSYLVKPVGRVTFQNTVKRYLPILNNVEVMEA